MYMPQMYPPFFITRELLGSGIALRLLIMHRGDKGGLIIVSARTLVLVHLIHLFKLTPGTMDTIVLARAGKRQESFEVPSL